MNLNDSDVMAIFQPCGTYMRRMFFLSDIGGSEQKKNINPTGATI